MSGRELSNNEIVVFSVAEVARILGTNRNYVYKLIDQKLLPALKLGSYKVRRVAMEQFLEAYEGFDLTNPSKVTELK